MDIDLGQLTWPCDCGKEHEIRIRELRIEAGAVSMLDEILMENQYQNPVFICDSNSRAAAEPFLVEEFKDYLVIEFDPDGLKVDEEGRRKVLSQVEDCDLGLSSVPVDILVAIGSGTIHDLARCAAQEFEIPFISVPTAASMSGYSANRILTEPDGIRKTLSSVAPEWILADTNIFAKAPWRLTAAGISDLVSCYIALADWEAAHRIGGTDYCEPTARKLRKLIRNVLGRLDEIHAGEPEAMEYLMYALVLSGFTTQILHSTRAISGAEHRAAHLWKMEVFGPRLDALYGETVLVGMFLVLEYYKGLVPAVRAGRLVPDGEEAKGLEYALLEQVFTDPELLEQVIEENTPNPLEDIDLEEFRVRLNEIAEIINSLPDPRRLREQLESIGCKTRLSDIGLSEDMAELTLRAAPYLKGNLSILRMAKLLERA